MELTERTLSAAFKERGIEDVVKIDVFPLKGEKIIITFESIASKRRQGIWLKTDGGIWIDGELCPSANLWQDTSPTVVEGRCVPSDGCLFLYNIWERDGVRSSLCYSSGMLVEELPSGRRYRCNDIGFNTRFDSIVFRIEQ